MKPSQMKKFLTEAIMAKMSVLIKGAPGVGKTDIVKNVAAETEADLLFSHPVVNSPIDYKGLGAIVDGKAKFLPFGDLLSLIEAKRLTICFMDDLGQAPPAVQAAAMQLILERRINGQKVSDDVVFIAATNRKRDKAGVSGILEPVKSRFVTIIEMTPDVDDWVLWALNNGMPIQLIAFIRFRPELLFDFQPTGAMTNSPCPRTVAHVGKLMNLGIPSDIELEVYTGAAGEGFASELVPFIRVFRDLPDRDEVFMRPETAPVPNEPAAKYAAATMLAYSVGHNTMDAMIQYGSRLGKEFEVLMIKDATGRDKTLYNNRETIKWFSDNKDVFY